MPSRTQPSIETTERVALLMLCPLQDDYVQQLRERYDLIYAAEPGQREEAVREHGARVRAVLTIGAIGLSAQEMDAMPRLELICALGVGHENIDLAAARARSIAVSNGAGTNDACVADHAFGLLLAAVRGIVKLDRGVREGLWRDQLDFYTPTVCGKKLGIVGMGMIGRQIARRAAGFDLEVGYFSRTPKADLPFPRFDSVVALAQWSDFLMVATPGGAETRHLVNADVIAALGPGGTLVNIARGSVVDTQALAQALASGALASAGLDVYESEPRPPESLIGLPNVVLTPHIAGRSPEAMQASVDKVIANVQAWFSGQPLLTPL
jgi:lactate dehydrogenase-like 2-hydroxyacid dehydrogenase